MRRSLEQHIQEAGQASGGERAARERRERLADENRALSEKNQDLERENQRLTLELATLKQENEQLTKVSLHFFTHMNLFFYFTFFFFLILYTCSNLNHKLLLSLLCYVLHVMYYVRISVCLCVLC